MTVFSPEEFKEKFSTSKELLSLYPNVTYRQLDHWVRRGMVQPTHVTQSMLDGRHAVNVSDLPVDGVVGSGKSLLWDKLSTEWAEADLLLRLASEGVEVGLAYKLVLVTSRGSASAKDWHMFNALHRALETVFSQAQVES